MIPDWIPPSQQQLMRDWGADCIITLGGDGTVRVAAKGSRRNTLNTYIHRHK